MIYKIQESSLWVILDGKISLFEDMLNKVLDNTNHQRNICLNTLTANYEYSRSNRENLPLPIQIKLSKKPSTFCAFFFAVLEFPLNFQCSETKMSLIAQVFLKLLTPKDVLI